MLHPPTACTASPAGSRERDAAIHVIGTDLSVIFEGGLPRYESGRVFLRLSIHSVLYPRRLLLDVVPYALQASLPRLEQGDLLLGIVQLVDALLLEELLLSLRNANRSLARTSGPPRAARSALRARHTETCCWSLFMDAPAQTPAMPTAKQPATNTVALHLGIPDAATGLDGVATLAFGGGPGILRAMSKKPYATIESELCLCGWLPMCLRGEAGRRMRRATGGLEKIEQEAGWTAARSISPSTAAKASRFVLSCV